ncbi:MAG: hypothetical protein JRC86_04820 [Deltaproteobacteria bacterium]|nr:hypothetical protein [Deltaproteobacteria bacterium]
MARRRMIDPDIWDDPDFLEFPLAVRYLFIAHFSLADDEGRGQSDPTDVAYIDEDGEKQLLTIKQVEKMLDLLSAHRGKKPPMVHLYEAEDGEDLYALPKWSRHQSVPMPKASIYPPPDITQAPQKRKRGRPGKLATEDQIELLVVMAEERKLDLNEFVIECRYDLATLLSREVPLIVQKLSEVEPRGPITADEEFSNRVIAAHKKGDFGAVKSLLAFPPENFVKVKNRILSSLGYGTGHNVGAAELIEMIIPKDGA